MQLKMSVSYSMKKNWKFFAFILLVLRLKSSDSIALLNVSVQIINATNAELDLQLPWRHCTSYYVGAVKNQPIWRGALMKKIT